jgi:hypothetical protein
MNSKFVVFALTNVLMLATPSLAMSAEYGPQAVLEYEMRFRGKLCVPDATQCYPEAKPIEFALTQNIRPLRKDLWTPEAIARDFARRTATDPALARKKGIIVVLKTERCATKQARFCSTTTAALEKRSTPLLEQFDIYGLELKPRDGDEPPGSKAIEIGADAWKNEAAREYGFVQGPGATFVFMRLGTGEKVARTDAVKLKLWEKRLIADQGRTPELESFLVTVLQKL